MSLEREAIIRSALSERLREVWQRRIKQLVPGDYGPRAHLASQLQAQISKASEQAFPSTFHRAVASTRWFTWEGDCATALMHLSCGVHFPLRECSDAPPAEPFMAELRAVRRNGGKRFELLMKRYACPLNVLKDSEQEAREHLLETLMVQDRARIEKSSITAAGSYDVLLKLNLLAVYAGASADLRYMDALNYYYEILPERWMKQSECAPWLYVTYLGLYARTLKAWLERKFSE